MSLTGTLHVVPAVQKAPFPAATTRTKRAFHLDETAHSEKISTVAARQIGINFYKEH
ncbi:hypothetical protein [Erwinia persicina]|uniref:hypothetical protein n=1 Tax=Erwinia persicina TaxID=55211 RepID=UPI000B124382|nr:hypothetical protein [Erwinia persicina]